MKQTYLLIITTYSGEELKRIVCFSKAEAKRECTALSGMLVTGKLYTATYSEEHGLYIPLRFVQKFRI